jgi:hypothetical protein
VIQREAGAARLASEPLIGDRVGQFSLRLDGGRRLVFVGDHVPTPRKSDGGIDWSLVTDVRIVEIGDYHD